MNRCCARSAVVLVAAGWLVAVTGGLRLLWGYSTAPGMSASAPVDWPRDTLLARDPNLDTLVMFVHPMCPCSRASAAELSRLIARCDGKIAVKVIAVQPKSAPEDWESSELLQ